MTPGGGSEPNHQARAQARSHSYALFSRLFLSPITADILPYLEAVAELQASLPRPVNLEEMAADHHHLFAFNVFPYEAVFLDESGLLGGAVTDEVRRRYRQAGYRVDADATIPDHVGHELGLLAFLCAAEADAHEDRLQRQVDRLRRLQFDFFQHHLLRWLPPFVLALHNHTPPFYARVGEMALQLIQDHVADLGDPGRMASAPLPRAPQPLTDEESGLKEIARFLVTPLHSGLYLSRDMIADLAREFDLPRGFGSREQLMVNTFRAAAQYDSLAGLLTALEELAAEWEAEYTALSSGPLVSFTATWRDRVLATRSMLVEMKAQSEYKA